MINSKMNRNRKYPKVTDSWTYGHIVVPEKLIYIGSSDEPECCRRWNPSYNKTTELQPYIEKHGWDNIKHIVFKDGLTPKQAKQLEDLLITQAKIDGWCINKQGSGWYKKDNPKEWHKQYYKDHIEHIQQYHYQYYKDHQKEQVEYSRQYYKDHREEQQDKDKERYYKLMSTTEGKIFYRVKTFNQRHKDRKIETPLEAKNKYLEYGYIPSYIKNDDLV